MSSIRLAEQKYADSIIGPVIIGSMVNIFLFGIALQAYINYSYSSFYQRDSRRTKLLFWVVCVFGLFEIALNVVGIYNYAVSQKRDLMTLEATSMVANLQPTVAGVVAVLVQCFLTHRAGTLFNSRLGRGIFHGIVGFGILAGILGAICVSAVTFSYTLGRRKALEYLTYNQAVAIWTWSSAAVDIAITLSLFLTLRKHIAGFNQEMDSILVKLMRLGLWTALPSTCLALAAAIASLTLKTHNVLTCSITAAFFLPLPSLYCLSLIKTLSYRENLATHSGFNPPPTTDQAGNPYTTFLTLHPVPSRQDPIPVQHISFSNFSSPKSTDDRGRNDDTLKILEEGTARGAMCR